jgi:hypothetical protein
MRWVIETLQRYLEVAIFLTLAVKRPWRKSAGSQGEVNDHEMSHST